ncbi:MAG: hypothetical protein AAFR30_09590, partial [Cyanobacteria bacterium J06628_4]
CEQINAVLRNVEITRQQFETIQEQSRELDRLQQDFSSPADWLNSGHTEVNQSEIDFLNHGPDAAAEVLRDHGWQSYEISLVIQDSMFIAFDEPKLEPQTNGYRSNGVIPASLPTQSHNGYVLSYPNHAVASIPIPQNRAMQRRQSRRYLGRDIFILTFMAAVALALLFTLL